MFRRIEPSKRSVGTFLKMEVFDPLGLNINIGLDEETRKKTRIADNVSLTGEEVMSYKLPTRRMNQLVMTWRLFS